MGLGDWWAQNVSGSGPDQATYASAANTQSAALNGINNNYRSMYAQGPVQTDFSRANGDYSGAQAGQNLLMQQAQGQGPSAAQVGASNALQQANGQIQSAALANQAGSTPGMTQRNVVNAQAQAGGQAIQNAALGRAQEGMNAINQYGQNANAMRNSSIQQGVYGAQNDISARNQQASLLRGQQGIANQQYDTALDYERQRQNGASTGYQQFGNALGAGATLATGLG